MKLKGVNPIEQHIEKMVLGLVLIILLGVIALQFVTTPNNIEDGGRSIEPAQVYTSLEQQANQLQSQITDLNPVLPEVQPVDLVERYDRAFANAGATRLTLSSPLGDGVNVASAMGADTGPIDIASSGPIVALGVPKTSTPIAAAQWATLDPYVLVEAPEYAQYLPAQQPYDFSSISVQASFSGTALQSVLNGENGGSAIPRRFWAATGIAILGFEAERQRLMPDGSWGTAEPIVTPPHTPTPVRAVSNASGLQDLVTVVGNAAREASEVVRPRFPPTIAGPEWIPPSDRTELSTGSEADQIKRVQRQLDRAREELERLTSPPGGPATNPGRNPRDPRNPGGGKTSDPAPTRPGSTSPGTPDRNNDRIERVRDRIKGLEDKLKELGVEEDKAARVRTSARDFRSILEEESIDLWAHDMGVEPGATYRYRTRVVVNNPLFRKQADLDPDDANQQALARDPFAHGAWSDWSEPVVAGAREYYFVTSASDGASGTTEPTKSTIELYRVFYGHYRKSTLNVSPGDGLASDVRISGNLLSFDTSAITAEEAAKAIADLENEETKSPLPAGISELSSRISIDLGVYVLDIYPGQEQTKSGLGGQSSTVMRVVLRSKDGELVVHTEPGDEGSLAFALASESASLATSTPLRAPGEPAISPAAELFKPVEP